MFINMDNAWSSPSKLDRSSSLTDLNKLFITSPKKDNIYHHPLENNFDGLYNRFGRKPLVRHFSCEQIYDPRISSSPLVRIKDIVSVGYQDNDTSWSNINKYDYRFNKALLKQPPMSEVQDTSGEKPDIKYFGDLRNFDFSFVKDCDEKLDVIPMDIDKSTEEPANDELENDQTNQGKIRKRRRVKKEDDVQENRRKILKGPGNIDDGLLNKRSKFRLLFMFLILPMISYATLIHDAELSVSENLKVLSQIIFGQRDRCSEVLNINPILQALQQNLYGQEAVIDELSRTFNVNIFKTLIFTGPTGVGKSYAVKLIEEKFVWSKNVHNVMYPISKSGIKVLKLSLSHCGYNLIVMDGLNNTNSEHLHEFVRSMQQYTYEKKIKTFMILVYSTQEISDDLKVLSYDAANDILKGFKSEFKDGLDISLIQFQKLNLEDVIRCVLFDAEAIGIEVSRENAEQIAKEIPEIYGCKGVRASLNVLKHELKSES